MNSKQYTSLFRIVQLATICVFFGRAYQHIFWDAPFRALLWDENWMSGIVETFSSMTWEEYSTSLKVDDAIQSLKTAFGYFYLCCGLIALFIHKVPRFLKTFLVLGALGLVFLAALYCKEKFYSAGQFFEYSLQFSSPIVLFYLARKASNEETILEAKFQFILKILIALTFTCHGLYALNYYPIPGSFMDMTISILGVSNETAKSFLMLAGILDFILAILLFLPKRLPEIALAYAIFWGFMTTIARIWAHFYWDFPMASLHQWAHESLFRFPHFLIPLFLLILLRVQNKTKDKASF